jgi:HPt (histidine-containing phosphotransfer) domain-containing protein
MGGKRFKSLPVIALTANAVSGMKEMFLENGFNDFLSKPIDTIKMDSVLRRWIPESKRMGAPVTDDEGGLREEPPEIQGVDTALGMSRIGGSLARYMDLLEKFLLDARAGLPLLERTPDDGGIRPFTTTVHAMKSALANIGAQELSKVAARLEAAARQADLEAITEDLASFKEELAALTDRIAGISESGKSRETQDGAETKETLEALRKALAETDVDAIDAALERLQALPLSGRTREAVSEIADFIMGFEFSKAEQGVIALYESQTG